MKSTRSRIILAVTLAGVALLVYAGRACLTVRAAELGYALPMRVALALGLDPNCRCGPGEGQLLHAAVWTGDLDLVNHLLGKRVPVDARNGGGATVLMVALARDEFSIASRLIAAGADVNARPAPDESILLSPVHSGQLKAVRLLLTAGTDPRPDSAELLIKAIREGRIEILKLLLDAGCDVNARRDSGSTPLMWAAMFSDVATIRLLVEHGADVRAQDEKGRSAVQWALQEDMLPNAAVLRSYERRLTASPSAPVP